CDATILVTAPKHARVQRLLKRGAGTLPEIEARMKNQWPDRKKRPLADFIIQNTSLKSTRKQVEDLHANLCKLP
ncbi:MAG: dephospho-CoA kinase, partial [Marinirhabdus sp.]